jgi:hypothetical protein
LSLSCILVYIYLKYIKVDAVYFVCQVLEIRVTYAAKSKDKRKKKDERRKKERKEERKEGRKEKRRKKDNTD